MIVILLAVAAVLTLGENVFGWGLMTHVELAESSLEPGLGFSDGGGAGYCYGINATLSWGIYCRRDYRKKVEFPAEKVP